MMDLVASTLRLSSPLILAAMGGLLSERTGVINIALEGFMLAGAFGAATVAFWTGDPWLGWGAGFAAGALLAMIYAAVTVEGRADQIVAGTAINLLVIGFLPFLGKVLFDSTGSTPSLPLTARFTSAPLLMTAAVAVGVFGFFRFTRWGLWLTFAGEHPAALTAAGISVRSLRWLAVLGAGGLAGWGGAVLSLQLASSYSPLMTAGRGFMALAALIAGKWRPLPTVGACLVFGLADSLQMRWQGITVAGHAVPVQFIQILPYLLTLLLIAGFVGGSRPPAGLGKDLDGQEIR